MSQKLLLEGGAAGHMAHPFDLEWVKTGKDLVNFFKNNVVQYLSQNEPSVKIDGTNVSFKLVQKQDQDGNMRFEFAVDRGSKKPIDIEGVTLDRIGERFPEGHGMRPAIESLLSTFNAALRSGELDQEIDVLGMGANPDLFFNTEYVLEREDETGNKSPINVVLYNENFFAIHGLSEFFLQTSPTGRSQSRKSREVVLDQEKLAALQSLIEKTRNFSPNFNIYGPENTKAELSSEADFDQALNQEVTILLSPDQPMTDTLGGWLNNPQVINPFGTRVTLANGKSVGALSKLIYTSVLPDKTQPVPLSELLSDNLDDRVAAMNGALFYHGTRLLGRQVLKSMTTDFGLPSTADHEGLVLRDPELFGFDGPVKITGDFIVTGMVGAISDVMKAPAEKPQAASIGLVPISAKPFHIGHMSLIEMAAKQNDQVKVFVSLSDRVKKNEFPVYGEQMQKIWNEHLMAIMPSNVDVDLLPKGVQPVRMVYETLGNANETNSPNVWRVYSDPKDTSQNYPEKYRQQYFGNLYKNGQAIFAAEENSEQFTRGKGTPDASGTMARKTLADENFQVFAGLMPRGVDAQAIWDILTGGSAEEEEQQGAPPIFMGESVLRFIFETIENQLNEQTEPFQRKMAAKHVRNRLTTKGNPVKEPPFDESPPIERSESAPPIGEAEELEEMSSMAAGDVQGYSGNSKKKKQPSLIREEDDELVEETVNYLLKMMRGGIR